MGPKSTQDEAVSAVASLRVITHCGLEVWQPDSDDALLQFALEPSRPRDEAARHAYQRRSLKRLIESVVRAIDDEEERDFYLACFALDKWAKALLWDRHRAIATYIGGAGTPWDSVRREPFGRELLRFIIKIDESFNLEVRDNDMDEVMAPRGYEILSIVAQYDLASGLVRHKRILKAVVDDVLFWEGTAMAIGRTQEEPVLIGAGTLTRHGEGNIYNNRAKGKQYFLRVDFPKPLMAGEEYSFMITQRDVIDTETVRPAGWLEERHFEPATTTRSVRMEVQFPLDGGQPGKIWQFKDLGSWLVPGVAERGTTIELEDDRFVGVTWENPTLGRACGLGWEW